jgi:hypothetical protein
MRRLCWMLQGLEVYNVMADWLVAIHIYTIVGL